MKSTASTAEILPLGSSEMMPCSSLRRVIHVAKLGHERPHSGNTRTTDSASWPKQAAPDPLWQRMAEIPEVPSELPGRSPQSASAPSWDQDREMGAA